MNTATAIVGQSNWWGRVIIRIVAAGVFALLVLGVASGSVGAEQNVQVTQHEFVQICKDTGGTPSRVGPRVVKCTNGNVTSVCNFKTKECTDTADRIVGGDQQQGVVAGAVAVESSPASGGPSAPTGGRAASVDQRVFGAVDNQQP